MNNVHDRTQLSKFIGKWSTTGRILETDNTSATEVTGTDTYEWLPGEYFLLHKVDVSIGNDHVETLEVIGFDKETGKYTMHYFDNKGDSGRMTAIADNDKWTFLGDKLRFNGGFREGGNEFSGLWEQSDDGQTWYRFMEIKLMRVQSLDR